jgi:uncharacterized protein YjbK
VSAPRRELEWKLALPSEDARAALVRALPGEVLLPERGVRQVNHFFDTAARDLRRMRATLRLREADGRFVLTAKGPAAGPSAAALQVKAEEEAEVPEGRAHAVLDGAQDPLELLASHIPPARSRLVARMVARVGDAPLVRVGSFENERRRLGPLVFGTDEGTVHLVLELDRTTFPGERVDLEVEAEVEESQARRAELALRALFARAGLPWTPATSKAQRFFELLDRAEGSGP